MCAEGVRARGLADVVAVGIEPPALRGVAQVRDHDLVEHLTMHGLVIDRHQRLHAPIEIARHPVGGANEQFGLRRGQPLTVAEAYDAAVLEKAPDDALHSNVFGKPAYSWTQTADAPHDQIDLHTGIGGAIKCVDDGRVDYLVHFRPDLSGPSGAGVLDLGFDELEQALPEIDRSERDLLQMRRGRVPRHVVEETSSIPAERGITCEEREVRVNLGGVGMIVTGAEMDIGM